jgi:benzoyl-CoA reductase subunit A
MSAVEIVLGIDLGSTTTKAVALDRAGRVIGRGITNTRSNYQVASQIVREEALVQSRFELVRQALAADPELAGKENKFLGPLARNFRRQQHVEQLQHLESALHRHAGAPRYASNRDAIGQALNCICDAMRSRVAGHFSELAVRKSDFFRDLAAADYMQLAEQCDDPKRVSFDVLCGLFDAAILDVENAAAEDTFGRHAAAALEQTVADSPAAASGEHAPRLRSAITAVRSLEFRIVSMVGTGYGRQRLPFAKEQIRSEILCHGLGAHAMFPGTRTVLDIGGQDTKAIQVDASGIVTSFQMNDRCAAGCGRYLGYIADEMNLGLHELGALAQQSTCSVKINSTCTVFAGAELRDRLSLGQKQTDILAGLHRAIMLRAMSLLARSGGISDEFTFAGGVARNPAAVSALQSLVRQNYGERKLNISSESIYTGALGAALFALRDPAGSGAA